MADAYARPWLQPDQPDAIATSIGLDAQESAGGIAPGRSCTQSRKGAAQLFPSRAFAEHLRKHRATQTTPAQHTAADQKPSKATLFTATLALALALIFILIFVPLAQEASEKQATQAPAAQHTTADQQACQPMVMVATGLDPLVFAALVLVLLLVPLTQEASEKQTAQAPTAQHATADQEACQPTVIVAAGLGFLVFAALALILILVPRSQEARQQ